MLLATAQSDACLFQYVADPVQNVPEVQEERQMCSGDCCCICDLKN